MADDSTTTSSTVTPQAPSSTQRLQPTPAESVIRGWRSSLRNQNQSPSRGTPAQQQQQPAIRRTTRPPSGVSSTRLSSNPSLLSLEQPPLSPTTTVASRNYPYATSTTSLPPPVSSGFPPRSPTLPTSSQHPPRQRFPSNGGGVGRHAAQLQRVYDKPRYDAEFDRGNNHKPSTASSSTPALFDPDAPPSSSVSATASVSTARQPHAGSNGNGNGPERRRERELREDGTVRRPRSKREPVAPLDLGRKQVKESKESLESVETDFSGRTKSSSGGGGGKKSRRRREGDGFDEQGDNGDAGASRRQLFDPRRDDPTRFNSSNSLPLPQPKRNNSTVTADTRSVAGMSIHSFNSVYSGNSDVVGAGGGGAEADDSVSINTTNSGRLTANDPALANLKRAYREVMDLEKKLQDEHRAAMVAKDREDDEQNVGKGVRLHGAAKNSSAKHDDEYWVRLANGHKQLADAHYSFLQLSLDPRLPASYHALPQKYNIPTRLWQVAFHQLLERMRHAVLAAPFSTPQFSSDSATTDSGSPSANVLEHLIEFIQYAYGHYSQLFEDPTVAVFRAAWIEQLGDLARYRMAVAGLASRVSAAQQQRESQLQQNLTSTALASQQQQLNETPLRREDAASIGQAALNDWDLEEQETWREMARDWYAQGVAETPGTGRLQHHLALLSKGERDELRGLYHYAKSLTAAHPYLSARESILPLFDQEHQSRRTLPEVGKSELFVHLHGMLFTKISLDDFDDCLGRFVERLQEEGWALEKGMESHGSSESTLYGDREWFMLAVVNIASMLQYGAEDGIIKKLTTKEPNEKHSSNHHSRQHPNRGGGGGAASNKNKVAPQAIMLNSARQQQAPSDDAEPLAVPDSDVVKQLAPSAPTSVDDDPLPFKLAQRLSFQLLDFSLSDPVRRIGNSAVANPYLTLVLTFLSHLSFHPEAFKHVERSVPWESLVEFFNLLPPTLEIRLDTPSKLMSSRGTPLPEDWCIRGMEWAGRQLFGRGYWRTDRKKGPRSGGGGGPLDSMLPPPIEGVDGTTMRVESEMDALKFDLTALEEEGESIGDEDGSATALVLGEARWRRLAITAAWLVRNVPGFDYDSNVRGDEPRFRISGPLKVKIDRWRKEDEDAKEAERLSQLSLKDRGIAGDDEVESDEAESDDEDDEDENDSPAVKELKARRRQLKSVIKSARASQGTNSSSRKGSRKISAKTASLPKVFPGFTVLVFDTNILLTSIKLFSELVEAACWTIVVPLAVVTELDGLRHNATPLGIAAGEVIEYLEQAVRTHSRYLKIQTSRGNYLKDLAIRNESIDFASPSPDSDDPLFSHEYARNMDDVILRAAAWQKDHFTSRLALVNPRAVAERKKVPVETAQVVLVTFDRNLRLKARARQLDATDEKELKKVLEIALVNG
ncbi:uncharacterized protein JCM6883_000484 [Sporobolomyces salmoneus]|uniref:uncharacterized protein n=1 Tax=Sporobolomyces salmoneus TaxID=183962 RepID=UPI00316E2A61